MINQFVPCPGGTLYTIRAGDTLFAIARSFGLSLETLLAANPDLDPAQNPGVDPNRLVVGQIICLPAPATCQGTIYTVRVGDTLFALAARFNTTVQAIQAANPGLDPGRLFVGQRICLPVPLPAPVCTGFTYAVRAGETLFALAARFNTTVQAIQAANPGLDPNRLQIGQEICIPVPAPAPPPVPVCPGFTYAVRAGETLFALAARFNTTVQAIRAANPGLDPNRLQIGQEICIPVPAPAPPPAPFCPGFIYTIQPGDTLSALANRFGSSVQAILAANPGLDPDSLQVARRICIPASRPRPGFRPPPRPGPATGPMTPVEPMEPENEPGMGSEMEPETESGGTETLTESDSIYDTMQFCPGLTYTIQPGDTLFALAIRFGASVQAIIAANPEIDPDQLQIGQAICIPKVRPAPAPQPGTRPMAPPASGAPDSSPRMEASEAPGDPGG